MPRRSCRRSLRTTLLCELLGRSRHRFPLSSGRRAAPAVPNPPAYDRIGKAVLRPTPALTALRLRADWFEPSPDSTRRLRAAHLSEARPPSHRPHFVSKYSSSGLVRPRSQCVIQRNVFGPSGWHGHRFQRGFGSSTEPNTVFTSIVHVPLLVCGRPQRGQDRRCSRSSAVSCATTKSRNPPRIDFPSARFRPSVSIASSCRSIAVTSLHCSAPSSLTQINSIRNFMAGISRPPRAPTAARWLP